MGESEAGTKVTTKVQGPQVTDGSWSQHPPSRLSVPLEVPQEVPLEDLLGILSSAGGVGSSQLKVLLRRWT